MQDGDLAAEQVGERMTLADELCGWDKELWAFCGEQVHDSGVYLPEICSRELRRIVEDQRRGLAKDIEVPNPERDGRCRRLRQQFLE